MKLTYFALGASLLVLTSVVGHIFTSNSKDRIHETGKQNELTNEQFKNEFVESSYTPIVLDNADSLNHRNTPERWWQSASVYEIWVRSFYDSNGDGNGDLNGIVEKLPYIKSLGVDAVWLSPIFESPSYHGYDTSNYRKIESDFGTDEDFDALVAAFQKANIKIILDLSLNHVSEHHEWFHQALNENPDFRDFFVWRNEIPAGHGLAWESSANPTAVWHKKPGSNQFYYGAFGWTQPDLNYANAKVQELAKSIAEFWLNRGVDGFRLDAIRYLVESDNSQADTQATLDFVKAFTAHVKAINPNALLIGEVVSDLSTISKYHLSGAGLDQAFDYSFVEVAKSLLSRPDEIENSFLYFDEKSIADSQRTAIWNIYKTRNADAAIPASFYASFTHNHDLPRLRSDGNLSVEQFKTIAALSLLAPGSVYLYYGEEINQGQAAIGSNYLQRAPMQWSDGKNAGFSNSDSLWVDNGEWFWWEENFSPWWQSYWTTLAASNHENVQAQKFDPDSTLNFYRSLLSIRKTRPSVTKPKTITLLPDTGSAWVVVYQNQEEATIVAINLNAENRAIVSDIPPALQDATSILGSTLNTRLGTTLTLDQSEVKVFQLP